MAKPHIIRKSKLIRPHGPGAIFTEAGNSFLVESCNSWIDSPKITLDRLSEALNGKELRQPPFQEENNFTRQTKLVGLNRFPNWLFCPSSNCRNLMKWRASNTDDQTQSISNKLGNKKNEGAFCPDINCNSKNVLMAPMRFIQICKKGHAQDVDWSNYVHRGMSGNCNSINLKFYNKNNNTSFSSLEIFCPECNARQRLTGITTRDFIKCPGFEQGMNFETENCDEFVKTVPYTAGNVWLPLQISAIDIPTGIASAMSVSQWIDSSLERLNSFKTLKEFEFWHDDEFVERCVKQVQEEWSKAFPEDPTIVSRKDLEDADEGNFGENNQTGTTIELIKPLEWEIFEKNEPTIELSRSLSLHPVLFKKEKDIVISSIEKIIRVESIKEVRVLKGYGRVEPPTHLDYRSVWGGEGGNSQEKWLPAIEAFGEGIFIKFDERRISKWEEDLNVINRVNKIIPHYEDNIFSSVLFNPSPRTILLHTFSHLFIKSLIFVAGYSGPSIKERIYSTQENFDKDMAGILIYTTDTDSQGTLGGLQEQANNIDIITIMKKMIITSSWCSLDPVCIESENDVQLGMTLNLSSCHACSIIAETSCENFNRMLDRKLLIDEKYGFFKEELKNIYK